MTQIPQQIPSKLAIDSDPDETLDWPTAGRDHRAQRDRPAVNTCSTA